MGIKFTKMHGLGNDFMVIDGVNQKIALDKKTIESLSNRHTGIGFDQCLLIETSPSPEVDFYYRIFNANGQEVGQCGNGARCLALFAQHYGLTKQKKLKVATQTTCMDLIINPNNTVTVTMPCPKLEPKDIPLQGFQKNERYTLPLKNGKDLELHSINVGNPHAVLVVDNVTSALVQTVGEELSTHPYFPEQANVGFMQIMNPKEIHLRVYERGCAETKACGSGAVAAAAIGMLYHQLADTVTVKLLGGELIVHWPNKHSFIQLTGPACFVYEGELCELPQILS